MAAARLSHSKFQAQRHYRSALRPQIALQQRMPRAFQPQHAVADLRLDAAIIFGEARFSELQLHFRHDVDGRGDRRPMLGYAAGHLQQDAMHLSLLLLQQAHQFVVLLDGLQRLHKNRLAAGADAMHYAIHAPLLLDLYRDHEALAAYGYKLLLHCAFAGEPPQVAAQRFLNRALLLFDFAAHGGQLGRGAIVKRAVGRDLLAEKTQEVGKVSDAAGKVLDRRPRTWCLDVLRRGLLPFFRLCWRWGKPRLYGSSDVLRRPQRNLAPFRSAIHRRD